ncbi:hypothetical protein ACFXG4_46175 [Nocardia sp. NPDC059246]|uniref:hypothetical protein n=1 Tax=unclassified Nocardia TaxID=2637762 RepID=UPI0036BB5F07
MTEPLAPTRIPGLRGEQAREWRQFVCWAAAAELPALPATADTVLAYLGENPGTAATQRGRVSALNAAHKVKKMPIPGAAEAIRRALNPGRAQRLASLRAHADTIIARLPVTGWPDALTGRRDAVILLLATEGLSWHQISALTQAEITLTEQAVTVGAQPLLVLPATDTAASPVRVFSRWATIVTHAPAATGHIRLEQLLTVTDPSAAAVDTDDGDAEVYVPQQFPARYAVQPVLCGFDARGMAHGYIDELEPLRPADVADIATAHLLAPPEPGAGPDLDSDWFERGIAARWRMKAVNDELDDLLDRVDAIAARYGIS